MVHSRIRAALICLAALSGVGNAATLDEQRGLFKSALAAIDNRDALRVAGYTVALGEYPLIDFLHYRWLNQQLRDGERIDPQIRDYLTYFPGTYAERLRAKWVEQLAADERWQRLLVVVRADYSETQQCHAYQARFALGEKPAWEPGLEALWLRSSRLSAACEEVIGTLEATVPPGRERVWKRIETAMRKGQTGSAGKLKRFLNDADKRTLDAWIRAYDNPAKARQIAASMTDERRRRLAFAQAVRQYSRDDAAAARSLWLAHRKRFGIGPAEGAVTDRFIAVRAALQRLPEAYDWLATLPAVAVNEQAHTWRTRAAMVDANWREVNNSIESMPASMRAQERWRYWQGRAGLQTGGNLPGTALRKLAAQTEYYGFLAADLLDEPYRFNHVPTPVDPARLALVRQHPRLIRAREFLFHNLDVEARREWESLLAELNAEDEQAAAVLAAEWGWHDRAVYTIARTGQRQDYELRFPMPYANRIGAIAKSYAVQPALIYGVIRRESAYREDARSRAGALGLMQLMPATARRVAQSLGTSASPSRLLDADLNIQLGTHYYRDMLDRFNQHQALAAAAYNAGPHRVVRWLPKTRKMPADVWVDTIPFKETRNYVRAVLAYATIFEWRSGAQVSRLRQRMPDVPVGN